MKTAAFTLIELLIVLALLGILTAISYPLYQNYTQAVWLVAARQHLQELSARQEAIRAEQGKYGDSGQLLQPVAMSSLYQRYQFTVELAANNQGYILKAIAKATKQPVSDCAELTLDHLGQRNAGRADAEVCWH